MGKKYTLSQQKYRAKQRAVTERIKREEAEAAAAGAALQGEVSEKVAKAPEVGVLSSATGERRLPESPEQEELNPPDDLEQTSDTESTIATPDTPAKASASRHLQGSGSTDESASESADSEPAEVLQENIVNDDCQETSSDHVPDSCRDCSEQD
ncbi:hypothetical protein COCSUDRAFT_53346, partial [Coccomyxa subellipsoidea C-169]